MKGKVIADFPGEAGFQDLKCTDLLTALKYFYGNDVAYSFGINDNKRCFRGSLGENVLKTEMVLPTYAGTVEKITLEVGQ